MKSNVQCPMSVQRSDVPSSMIPNLEVPFTLAKQTLDIGHWTSDFSSGHSPRDFLIFSTRVSDSQLQFLRRRHILAGTDGTV